MNDKMSEVVSPTIHRDDPNAVQFPEQITHKLRQRKAVSLVEDTENSKDENREEIDEKEYVEEFDEDSEEEVEEFDEVAGGTAFYLTFYRLLCTKIGLILTVLVLIFFALCYVIFSLEVRNSELMNVIAEQREEIDIIQNENSKSKIERNEMNQMIETKIDEKLFWNLSIKVEEFIETEIQEEIQGIRTNMTKLEERIKTEQVLGLSKTQAKVSSLEKSHEDLAKKSHNEHQSCLKKVSSLEKSHEDLAKKSHNEHQNVQGSVEYLKKRQIAFETKSLKTHSSLATRATSSRYVGDRQHLDGAKHITLVDLEYTFPQIDGVVTGWKYFSRRNGKLWFLILRPTKDSKKYQVVDQHLVTGTGKGSKHLRLPRKMSFRGGDRMGWRFEENGGIIPFSDGVTRGTGLSGYSEYPEPNNTPKKRGMVVVKTIDRRRYSLMPVIEVSG